jgi:hypothetical protein
MSENNDLTREELEGIYNHSHPKKPELPPVLEKATRDYFSYRLQLNTGEVIHFSQAELVGDDWIHLTVEKHDHGENNYRFDRGVDVRLSTIVWIQDDGQ